MTRAAALLARDLERLEPVVRRAGAHLLAAFGHVADADVQHKGRVDLVTRLDLEAQAMIVADLAAAFPGDAIVAEEAASVAPERGPVWFVDPLDGTTNFVHGQPPFAVSVARMRDGRFELGAVHAPYLREYFHGCRGGGAFLDGRPLQVSRRDDLDAALLVSGFPYDVRTNRRNNLREWAHFAVSCRGLRRTGAASLDLAYVAAGRFDAYWEYGLKPWDLAAGVVLVEEAGGRSSDMDGGSDLLSGDIVATNGALHARVLAELATVRRESGNSESPRGF